MKITEKIFYTIIGVILSFPLGGILIAQAEGAESVQITSPIEADNFTELLSLLAGALVKIAIPILVIIIIWSGIQLVISAGSPEKIGKAWKTLKFALIGFAIILIGEGFVTLIKSILELRN